MTNPKQVSDFAKEYEEMYISLGQLKSAFDILFNERGHWKKAFDMEHEAFLEFQKNTLENLEKIRNE